MVKRHPSNAEVLAQIPKARARARLSKRLEPHAKDARFDKAHRTLHVALTNGAALSIPVDLVFSLRGASDEDLSQVAVGPAGVSLRWDALDTDLTVVYLANAALGSALLLRAAGAAGGASRTRAKVLAAKANGRKGGRPRRITHI